MINTADRFGFPCLFCGLPALSHMDEPLQFYTLIFFMPTLIDLSKTGFAEIVDRASSNRAYFYKFVCIRDKQTNQQQKIETN